VGSRSKLPRIVKQSIQSFVDNDCVTLSAALALVSASGLFFGREVMPHEFEEQMRGEQAETAPRCDLRTILEVLL